MTPALSVRDALASVAAHRCAAPVDEVAADYAARFGGVPATSLARPEDVALYTTPDHAHPVLLGLYGDERRVRDWLPGLPARATPATARALVADARPPRLVQDPPCAQVDLTGEGLGALPVLRATPRDAGPFLTMGLLSAHTPDRRELALSVHRMLVLDDRRLTLWMVPGRQLRAEYEAAVARGERLPVTINLGAPPAAVIASALGSRFLGVGKLAVAGALARAPIDLAAASQPAWTLAESEIAIEGHLDGSTADECLGGEPGISLPEFLGYDGSARAGLPVVTVTRITARESALCQAVIGPGREQSVILGLASALSVALSEQDDGFVVDLHFSAAGGGMLLLAVAVAKRGSDCDRRLGALVRRVFAAHPFVKLVVFTDDDVDVRCAEDVLWAVTTRANLGADATTEPGFAPLGMDPSQGADWAAEDRPGGSGRTWVDATVPFRLRDRVARSFPGGGR